MKPLLRRKVSCRKQMLLKMDNYNRVIRMIEMVKANPCLYDKRYDDYKDFKHKERVWKEIAKQVNLSVSACRTKWKNLRDKYRRKKLSEDQPSGSGNTWMYMESLEFLSDILDPISTNTNTSEELVDDQIFPTKISNAKMDTSEVLVDDQIFRTKNTNAKEDTSELLVDDEIFRTTPKPNHQKHCKDDLFNDVLKAMKRKYEGPQFSNNHKYEHFFGMLGNKLDKLTESEVDEVEIEILNLVTRKLNASRKSSRGTHR
ncbi:uncharacterized protein LOC105232356 [Bactrocera dorsalis]|uniref:Uncharacterized protein LOC105232356 n=2 Tax=Bactrocera dorsalis TaxID=27457 RepID=A0A6I9VG99_BACDO|nr:uncharacterized protein LOC105232356 [Bactrocera dorsalis]